MRHRGIYESLKRLGFSPAKAAEVLVDARRRGGAREYARKFVGLAFSQRQS